MQSKTWWLLAAGLVVAAIIVACLIYQYGLPRMGLRRRFRPLSYLVFCFAALTVALFKGNVKRLIRCSCNPKHPALSKYD